MERSTPSGRVRRWVIFRAGWHALSRACGADTRAANLPLCAPILARIVPQFSDSFQGRMGKGRGSLDSRPFLPLTGYALGLSRHLTWVTVSDLEEELRRLTIDSAGRLTEEFESIRRGAREYLAGAPEGPDAPMVD
jgi:hypothetical protein